MSKLNSKKMLTVLITLAMIFSALAVISMAAEPAYAQPSSSSPSYDPTVFSAGVQTVVAVSGGSFTTAGGLVNFYLGTSPTYSSSDPLIGTARLPAGSTSFPTAQAVNFTIPAGTAAGTSYYIIAEDVAASSFVGYYSGITVTTLTPTIALSPNSLAPNTVVAPYGEMVLTGSGFDPSSTLNVYLSYAGSATVLVSSLPVSASGAIPVDTFITVPTDEPSGVYAVVAQEVTGTGPNAGITADAHFTLNPAIGTGKNMPGAVTSILGTTTGSSFTIYGFGFPYPSTISTATGTITVGGVAAIQTSGPATPVSPTGTVTLSVVGLASAISVQGPQTITITTSVGTLSFPDSIWVSNPGVHPTLTVTDVYTGSSSGNGTDPLLITASGFTRSGTLSVYFDGTTVLASQGLDTNGFAYVYSGPKSSEVVPLVPAGTYNVFAADSNGLTAKTTFIVDVEYAIKDSASNNLNGEYGAVGSTITVYASGLQAYQHLDILDTGLATTSLGFSSLAEYYLDVQLGIISNFLGLAITTGSFDQYIPAFVADGTGTVKVSYMLDYHYTTLPTGTPETVSLVSLPSTTLSSSTYLTVGLATASPAMSYKVGQTVTLSLSGLVPYLAAATPGTEYWESPYSISVFTSTSPKMPGSPQSLSSGKTYFDAGSSGSATVSFAAPGSEGLYALYVFAGVSTPSGALTPSSSQNSETTLYYLNYAPFIDFQFIVSTASAGSTVVVNPWVSGTTGGSGSSADPYTMYPDPNFYIYGLLFDMYGLPANSAVIVTYYTASGAKTATVSVDSNGASDYSFASPSTVGGIPYQINFALSTTPTVLISSTYYEEVPAAAWDQTPFLDNSGSPQTDYFSEFGMNAMTNTNVTVYVNSLEPNTVYNVDLYSGSSELVKALAVFTTDNNGNATVPVYLPNSTASGTYTLVIAYASTDIPVSPALSLTLEVTQAIYAFPGQIITYSVIPVITATSFGPGAPGTVFGSGLSQEFSYGPVYVTVLLNGTAYTTAPAAFAQGTSSSPIYLNGSFLAPNAVAGTWWYVTYTWSQTVTSVVLVGGSPASTSTSGSVYQVTGTTETGSSTPAKLFVVQGNGALLTGISSSEIATIEAQLSSTITTTLQVPLSELSANITALHGDIVQITTAFGTMTTTLKAINATVASISSGQAIVLTDLGSIKTSLASLNASIAAFNGNIVTINTTLGQVKTTLAGINTQVTTNGQGIATIKTDLGTISGVVTATNGTVSTIETNLGTLNATVTNIHKATGELSTLEIFLIVAIVLILITLVIAFLAVSNTNKLSKKFEEQKKQ